jgi:hypothetical protein
MPDKKTSEETQVTQAVDGESLIRFSQKRDSDYYSQAMQFEVARRQFAGTTLRNSKPTVNDDATQGFVPGSRIYVRGDRDNGIYNADYVCISNDVGNALWLPADGYYCFEGVITQAGNNIPLIGTIFKNTLGVIITSYEGVGEYTLTVDNNTSGLGSQQPLNIHSLAGYYRYEASPPNDIILKTYNMSLIPSNDILGIGFVKIIIPFV